MYHWLVSRMIRRTAAKARAGDMGPTLAMWAEDAHFVFPGRSSWAADFRSHEELARWYERFVRVGLQLEPEEILVKGWPWKTTVAIHFTDHAKGPDGDVVYSNRGVLFGKVVWGKIRSGTVYEDTQKVADFDDYLAEHEPIAASQHE
jgi:ketosteroid isomerase-like protein